MRRLTGLWLCISLVACASTHHYARRPEQDRASHLAVHAIQKGMTLGDVVVVMINVRLPSQYASLASEGGCDDASVELILHAGELLAQVDGTRVHAGGFASIQSHEEQRLTMEGFERQGAFMEAVRTRQRELLVCSDVVLSFDAKTEGGCGQETIALTFDHKGGVATVGPVTVVGCGP